MKKLMLFLGSYFLVFGSVFSQEPTGYYNTAAGKTGAELKTALHNIIKDHNSPYSYGSSFWSPFETTDKRADGKVWDMYSNCNFTFGAPYQDNGTGGGVECDKYNREHSFPQEWFGGSTDVMRTDLFHIYLTDKLVNGKRSNYPYGKVSNATWVSANGSKLGYCSSCGTYNGLVFEPIDEYKGDFARSYFYMATRYENLIANWSSCDICNGTVYPAYDAWVITMLLEWHFNDPVSQKEIDRNNAVYAIQHNRNPFIDHPEYAVCIWQAANCEATNIIENNEDDIIFYPNPVSTELNVQCAMCNVQCVEIFDITGKLHSTLHFDFSTKKIDVVDLPVGTYFIKIGEKTGKFVKE